MATSHFLPLVIAVVCSVVCNWGVSNVAGLVSFEESNAGGQSPLSSGRFDHDAEDYQSARFSRFGPRRQEYGDDFIRGTPRFDLHGGTRAGYNGGQDRGRHHGGHHGDRHGDRHGGGQHGGGQHGGGGHHGNRHHGGGPLAGGGHHGGGHHGGRGHGGGHHGGGHHGGRGHGSRHHGGRHHDGRHGDGGYHGCETYGGCGHDRDHDDWRDYDSRYGLSRRTVGEQCTRNYQWRPIRPPPYDREVTSTNQRPDRDPLSDSPRYLGRNRRYFGRNRRFSVTFGGHGRSKSWWTGPNVCKDKTSVVTNVTDTDLQSHDVSYSISCDYSDGSVLCKTIIVEDGKKMDNRELMECCQGFSRKIGDYGCPKVERLVETFTFLQQQNLTNFLHALQAMGIDDEFQGENITLFAPINSGFEINGKPVQPPKVKIQNEMLLKNVIKFSKSFENTEMEDISDTLLYHIVPGLIRTNLMGNNEVMTTASPIKSTIRVNIYYTPLKVVTANCIKVRSADHKTKNGVVHIVDKVLEPVTSTLSEYISSNPDLSDFSDVIHKAGLSNLLESDGHLTVFAPTNSAFQKLDKTIYKKLLQGRDDCSGVILKHHILPSVICTTPIVDNIRQPNIIKEYLHLYRDEAGKLFVNNAQMVVRDIPTTNGVVHIIDNVLVPESAKSFLDIAKSKNADVFANLFREKEMTKYFSQLKNITVYLPTNEAMKMLTDMYTDNTNISPDLADILKYHIAEGVHTWSSMYNNKELQTLNSEGKKLLVTEYTTFFFSTKWTHTVQCVRPLAGPISTCNGIVYLIEKVLMPPENNVIDILMKDPRLTSFVNALKTTGLIENILNKTDPYTVFAPTNEAFERLNARQREEVESNPAILSSYIHNTSLCCSTLEGNGFRFRGGHIISCDNMATDGVVHIVDRIRIGSRRQLSRWGRILGNIFTK